MNTKKIKTAIIVMLVIANVFFIYNLYMLNEKTSKIPQQMIDDAVIILNRNGLNVSREAIPDTKPQNFIYEGVYSQETFEEIVRSLSEAEITNTYPMAEGRLYTAGEYSFEFGRSVIEDPLDYFTVNFSLDSTGSSGKNEVEADYEDGEDLDIITQNLIAAGIKGYKKVDISRAEKLIAAFLKKYQPGTVEFETVGFQKNADSEYVIIRQKLEGLAFDSHIVFVEISDKKIRTFSGKWFFGEFTERLKMPLFDSVNILFKCLEKDGNVIEETERLEKIELYYSLVWHEKYNENYREKYKFYLIPSWRLNFDSGKELLYSTITGDKPVNN